MSNLMAPGQPPEEEVSDNEPTHAEIAALAYTLWLKRNDNAMEDWLAAERTLRVEKRVKRDSADINSTDINSADESSVVIAAQATDAGRAEALAEEDADAA